ncbi:MAG: AcrR family transcriptional regulator [Parvibaculaceae bacterium]|jgi:AcrR family transcriptional regulator
MRRKAKNRINEIAKAAIICFGQTGYLRTQMSYVAQKAGVSTGTLYLYAANKEALFHLAVLATTNADLTALEQPVSPPGFEKTVEIIQSNIQRLAKWPQLDALLDSHREPSDEELRQALLELYDLQSTNREAIWMIDRCSIDVPELDVLAKANMRGRVFDMFKQLIHLIDQDLEHKRSEIETRTSARLILETIAWSSMHRHRETPLHQLGHTQEDEVQIRHAAINCAIALFHTPSGASESVQQ